MGKKGHYRHYKSGKVTYIKPTECHWKGCDGLRLVKKQSTIRLTDIFEESSSLERFTLNYLDEHNIKYKTQFSFDGLKGDGGVLRFDFAIQNNDSYILIECQGEQHYHPVDIFGGEEQFEKQQKYDKLKVDYCEVHNLTLLCMDGRKIKTESDVTNWLNENLMPLLEK